MNLQTEAKGARTMLFEDGLHVGTILEQQAPKGRERGLYMWYTASTGGRATTREEAEQALLEELSR